MAASSSPVAKLMLLEPEPPGRGNCSTTPRPRVLEKRAEMGRQLDMKGWGHIADDKEERKGREVERKGERVKGFKR